MKDAVYSGTGADVTNTIDISEVSLHPSTVLVMLDIDEVLSAREKYENEVMDLIFFDNNNESLLSPGFTIQFDPDYMWIRPSYITSDGEMKQKNNELVHWSFVEKADYVAFFIRGLVPSSSSSTYAGSYSLSFVVPGAGTTTNYVSAGYGASSAQLSTLSLNTELISSYYVFDEVDTIDNTRNLAIEASKVSDTPAVPEPTTATLTLLALAGLAARRRRK